MGYSIKPIVPMINMMKEVIYVEVGVDHGDNIKKLVKRCKNIKKVYGVDHWGEYADDKGNIYCKPHRYRQTLEHLKDEIASGKVEIIKGKSVDVAKKFPKRYDMIFIDGEHTYKAVLEDLESWFPHINNRGGCISGHDYHIKGVAEAVKRFCKKYNTIHHYQGKVWWFFVEG